MPATKAPVAQKGGWAIAYGVCFLFEVCRSRAEIASYEWPREPNHFDGSLPSASKKTSDYVRKVMSDHPELATGGPEALSTWLLAHAPRKITGRRRNRCPWPIASSRTISGSCCRATTTMATDTDRCSRSIRAIDIRFVEKESPMDANQVKKFCDVVAQLIVPLATFAGTEPGQRDANDEVLVRQLRVAGGAINDALSQVARLTPPTAPPMPAPPAATEPAAAPVGA